jgi:hypothetical protein
VLLLLRQLTAHWEHHPKGSLCCTPNPYLQQRHTHLQLRHFQQQQQQHFLLVLLPAVAPPLQSPSTAQATANLQSSLLAPLELYPKDLQSDLQAVQDSGLGQDR